MLRLFYQGVDNGMSDSSITQELWPDKEVIWERNPRSGVFRVVSVESTPVHPELGVAEIGPMIGCPSSNDPADSDLEGGQKTWFPRSFKYSPNTGKPLSLPDRELESWLPPFGNQGLPSGVLKGARLTTVPLRIEASSVETRPDSELTLPQHGEFLFCVGAFGGKSSCLLALEPAQGLIFCFLPSNNRWVELMPAEGNTNLGSFTGSLDAWGIRSSDLVGSAVIFWPSDHGLFRVGINLLSMTYATRVICEGRCLTAPASIGGQIFALVERNDQIGVFLAGDGDKSEDPKQIIFATTPQGRDWRSPYVTARDIFWLSESGQIALRGDKGDFFNWPSKAIPRFELGSIHASSDGKFWQLCEYVGGDEGDGVAYIQIARAQPEIRNATPRTLTGSSSVKFEAWLPGDPWIEPELMDGPEASNDETVVPLVESLTSKTLLCMRVQNSGNLVEFFEKKEELLSTTFQIMDQHDENGFYRKKLNEPWRTQSFVFKGTLFLYHPSMNVLPGWKLNSAI